MKILQDAQIVGVNKTDQSRERGRVELWMHACIWTPTFGLCIVTYPTQHAPHPRVMITLREFSIDLPSYFGTRIAALGELAGVMTRPPNLSTSPRSMLMI